MVIALGTDVGAVTGAHTHIGFQERLRRFCYSVNQLMDNEELINCVQRQGEAQLNLDPNFIILIVKTRGRKGLLE